MRKLDSLFGPLKRLLTRLKDSFKRARKRVIHYMEKKPYKSFFIALGIFLLLIVLSNILGSPKAEEKKPAEIVKSVKIYSIGSAPKLTIQAQIEKSGVVRISSLTPGVVQAIYTEVGQDVSKGQVLFSLSSNYQGGNSFSLQRQLAETQYKNVLDTYDLQKDIVKKQRDIAEKGNTQADDLRDITSKSVDDTNTLINLNDEILSGIDKKLAELQAANVGGIKDADILQVKELKSQFLAGNNQAKQALRLSQYNAAGDKPPADLSNTQKDLALKQLDLQDKMLDLGREISRIQLSIARVTEAMMFPAAPFAGRVQKISVKVGQAVNPGTELMVLSQAVGNDPTVAIAYVSSDTAEKVSRLEPSLIHINSNTAIESYPSFVTEDAIQGSLYGIYFPIPDQYVAQVTEKGFIQVEIPIGYFDTGSAIPYIPIDAIYQTKEQNFVFVARDGHAQVKSVELGGVIGSFVEISNGLLNGDRVIVNRNVIAGDRIAIEK